MKTQYYYFIVGLLLISNLSYAQLQITNQGRVGIGTNAPWERLHVANGSAIIANNGRSLRLWPWIGVNIGSNYRNISMWEKDSKWNDVYARKYFTVSDKRLKTEIKPIKNALNIISQLNGVYYRYKNDSVILPKNSLIDISKDYSYGFIRKDYT